MRECPYCAEEIKDEAVKCLYCGEFLSEFKSVNMAEVQNDSEIKLYKYGKCTDCKSPLRKNSDFCPECRIIQIREEENFKIIN